MPVQKKRKKTKKNHFVFDRGHRPDYFLFFLILGLTLFGLMMIYNASAYEGFREFHDKFYFAKQQLVWIIISVAAGSIAYLLPYQYFKQVAPLFLGIVFVLLVIVLIPGIGSNILGARRWIIFPKILPGFPAFALQPSEFAKPALILYFAAWLSTKSDRFSIEKMRNFVLILGVIFMLIMAEPDLGTAIIITSTTLGVYFAAGAPVQQFLLLLPVGLIGIVGLIIAAPYRLKRLTTFLNPSVDPQGASYHISQILITLGSGGIRGVGLGNSGQKYGYLPEATTDSIFAVIGGELGYLGALVLIFFYTVIIFRALHIAKNAPDLFSQIVALGIAMWLGFQTIVNMGSMVALFPLTGVPLPFISYGGSSLLTVMFATGLLLNISRYTIAEGHRKAR